MRFQSLASRHGKRLVIPTKLRQLGCHQISNVSRIRSEISVSSNVDVDPNGLLA